MGGNTSNGQGVVEQLVGESLKLKEYREITIEEYTRMRNSGDRDNCFVRQARYVTWKGTTKGRADFLIMRKRPKKVGGLEVNFIHVEAKHQDSSGSTADKIPSVFEDFYQNSLNVDAHVMFLSGKAWRGTTASGEPSAEAKVRKWAENKAAEMTKVHRRCFRCIYQDEWGDEGRKLL